MIFVSFTLVVWVHLGLSHWPCSLLCLFLKSNWKFYCLYIFLANWQDAPNVTAIRSSKAVGEPPFFLASSVFFAIKDAIIAARAEAGYNDWFPLDNPATPERIRMACTDEFTTRFVNSDFRPKLSVWCNILLFSIIYCTPEIRNHYWYILMTWPNVLFCESKHDWVMHTKWLYA